MASGYSGYLENEDGFLLLLAKDFVKGELDPMANKNFSHRAECLHYTSDNITLEVAMEMDKLGLDKCYNRALKASQDVSIFCMLYLYVFFFFLLVPLTLGYSLLYVTFLLSRNL